jgi:hypothetical protein
MVKGISPIFSIYLINNLRVIKPNTNETIPPTIIGIKSKFIPGGRSLNSSKKPPRTMGKDNKKENLALSVLGILKILQMVIVAPRRETPGIIASP